MAQRNPRKKASAEEPAKPECYNTPVVFRDTKSFVVQIEEIAILRGLDKSSLVRMVLRDHLHTYARAAE